MRNEILIDEHLTSAIHQINEAYFELIADLPPEDADLIGYELDEYLESIKDLFKRKTK